MMRLKLLLKQVIGREPFVRLRAHLDAQRVGSEYGGWYLALDKVPPQPIVYSCGIGEDITFDETLLASKHARVFAFDPTPRVVSYISANTSRLANFTFVPVAIGPADGTLTLYPPSDPTWVSFSSVPNASTADRAIAVPVRSIESLMAELLHARLDVLKLDIEGSEYEVIESLLRRRTPIGHLLVEFHHRFAGIGVEKTRSAIRHLHASGFLPYAVGETGREMSFIHQSLL